MALGDWVPTSLMYTQLQAALTIHVVHIYTTWGYYYKYRRMLAMLRSYIYATFIRTYVGYHLHVHNINCALVVPGSTKRGIFHRTEAPSWRRFAAPSAL